MHIKMFSKPLPQLYSPGEYELEHKGLYSQNKTSFSVRNLRHKVHSEKRVKLVGVYSFQTRTFEVRIQLPYELTSS